MTLKRGDPSRPNSCLFTTIFFLISLSIMSSLPLVTLRPVEARNGSVPGPVEVSVGLILENSTAGKVTMSSINMALSDFYSVRCSNYTTRLVLSTRYSNNDAVASAAAALDLIKNVKVEAILGPTTSKEAAFVIHLGGKAQVPIISFTATVPSPTSTATSYFFRATQNDSTQATAISSLVQAYGWKEAIIVYVNDQYGQGILPGLSYALESANVRIAYRSAISPVAADDWIVEELYKLKAMQTRVFIVHMLPGLGSRLFCKVNEVGMMSAGYVWIVTDGIMDLFAMLDRSVVDSMQGVVGVRPYVPRSRELKSFEARWKRKFRLDNLDIADAELDVFALWGYDAATALAMAIERSWSSSNSGYEMANLSGNLSNDLDSFGVSLNGPKLLQALSETSIRGLTGDFRFVDGQLPAATYQIINVNGKEPRGVRFWTQDHGLSESSSVIWPGGTSSVPKGWQIPSSGKKLRIGVPFKDGYSQFVKVTTDPNTNTTSVTGYCIDVFTAAIRTLRYSVEYEFIPYSKTNGSNEIPAGTYDDLIYQVYLGNFDAVVGDTTIIANRSLYVDFTLPYTESGVSMIVPVTDGRSNNAWAFLKPLTWDLWVTSLCSFVFIGFVVWVLEHRINDDFRGPPAHQIGTIFWFSFSTLVFGQKERVISNLARIVVIVWFFVVLILTQSYTASLASLLTMQQLQPKVKDVNQLISKGEYVGYLEGSFVFGILKSLGFDESKLRIYKSPFECEELFIKGSRNGGIAAAFDEVPYMKFFLTQHCSKYTMIEPTFKTDGFGFVFPRGSPLVSDISRAILNVTEGDKMKHTEEAWLGTQTNCSETSNTMISNSLDLNSFWGLFLLAGGASIFALSIFFGLFLCQHTDELQPSASICGRIRNLLRLYDERNLRSFPFRKNKSLPDTDHSTNPAPRLPHEANNEQFNTPGTRRSIELVSSNHERDC